MSDRPDQRQDLRAAPADVGNGRADSRRHPPAGRGLLSPELLHALEPIVDAVIAEIADRVAERVLAAVSVHADASSPWLDTAGACAYLGYTPDVLYKLTGAKAIPYR